MFVLFLCLVTQLCPTLCYPMGCNPACSSVHGIFQARILEWVAIFLLQGIFLIQESNQGLLHCRWILYKLSYQGSPKGMFKILQTKFQQYVSQELPDLQAGFRKGRGTRDQIANIWWIIEKAREFQRNFCFIQTSFSHDVLCIYKQGGNIQPCHTPFPILNQSSVPCPVLIVASCPACRFLRRKIRWSGIPIQLMLAI